MKKWRRTFAEQNFNNNNVMVKRLTGSIVLALMLGTPNSADAVGQEMDWNTHARFLHARLSLHYPPTHCRLRISFHVSL